MTTHSCTVGIHMRTNTNSVCVKKGNLLLTQKLVKYGIEVLTFIVVIFVL